jgi:phage/plasmid-like protein (TIGR03299 family)
VGSSPIQIAKLRPVIKSLYKAIKRHTDICQFKLKLSDPCAKIRLLNKQTKEIKMADAVEIINGVGSMYSFREPAWHGLGTVVTEEHTTSEVMDIAHLSNWNVRLEDVQLPEDYTSSKSNFLVVRDHPEDGHPDVLAVVGERYQTLQNEELFAFADNLLDGARWETAGSLKNGRVVFGSLALERETVLDPSGVADVVKSYLLVNTSHDGSLAVRASVTPVRVVCANTLDMALRGVKQSFKMRHTSTLEGRILVAREALGLANTYMDAFDKMAQELIEKEITKDTFNKIVEKAYPMPSKDAKGAMTKWETKIELLDEIFASDTNSMINNTAWGAFNTLTERLDWYRSARNGNNEGILASASGFDPVITAEKNKLLSIVKEVAFA